jgi:hypothetical protein
MQFGSLPSTKRNWTEGEKYTNKNALLVVIFLEIPTKDTKKL